MEGDLRARAGVGGVAVLAAVLGIAAIPAASYPAHAAKHQAGCAAKAPRCATLIVHVYGGGGPRPTPEELSRFPNGRPLAGQPLRIARLGPDARVHSSRITQRHTLRLSPGRYGVAAMSGGFGTEVLATKKVTLSAGQTLEITLHINEP
jgi:hypothetical protein